MEANDEFERELLLAFVMLINCGLSKVGYHS